jgi:hypothetical protein
MTGHARNTWALRIDTHMHCNSVPMLCWTERRISIIRLVCVSGFTKIELLSAAFFHHDPLNRVTPSSSTEKIWLIEWSHSHTFALLLPSPVLKVPRKSWKQNAVTKSKNSPTVAAHGTFGRILSLFDLEFVLALDRKGIYTTPFRSSLVMWWTAIRLRRH